MAKDWQQKIRQYYFDVDKSTSVEGGRLHVDISAVDRIAALFDTNAIYNRERFDPIHGKSGIIDFLIEGRSLVGTHTTLSVDEKGGLTVDIPEGPHVGDDVQTITVKGHYDGHIHVTEATDGSATTRKIKQTFPAQLDYTDIWVVSPEKVLYRHSAITPKKSQGQSVDPGDLTLKYAPYI